MPRRAVIPAGTLVSVFRLRPRTVRDIYRLRVDIDFVSPKDIVFEPTNQRDRDRGPYSVYGRYARRGFMGVKVKNDQRFNNFVLMVEPDGVAWGREIEDGVWTGEPTGNLHGTPPPDPPPVGDEPHMQEVWVQEISVVADGYATCRRVPDRRCADTAGGAETSAGHAGEHELPSHPTRDPGHGTWESDG